MSFSNELRTQYTAAQEDWVWFDLSQRTKIELTGVDRAAFMHNFCTNDISGLAANRMCEAYLCNARGKVLASIAVCALPVSLWIDAAPGLGPKIVQHLDRYLITEDVTMVDRTQDWTHLLCVGPRAASRIRSPLERSHVRTVEHSGVACVEYRDDWLGLPTYHLLCPRDLRVEATMDAGRQANMECYELLRIEAGAPEYGQDVDESNYPQEVNRVEKTVSFTKGCYLGQEPIVMIRDRGQVQRLLVGLRLEAEVPAQVQAKILHDGSEIGRITSSAVSPRLGSIALGYVRRGSHDPGARVAVEMASDVCASAVVTAATVAGT
jgi:folate-binding protein YgfZ